VNVSDDPAMDLAQPGLLRSVFLLVSVPVGCGEEWKGEVP
jgi:hypothetical protein